MIKAIRVFVALCLLGTCVVAQRPTNFSIDQRKPYIDIVFERYGSRQPVYQGETEKGVWLRLRNNCIVPIKAYVLRRTDNRNEGSMLVHEVIAEKKVSPVTGAERKPAILKPNGYANVDIVTFAEIAPKGTILFSVPLTHVTRNWDVLVEVFLKDPSDQSGKQPRVFVNFDWFDLPKEIQALADELLFGPLPK